MDLGTAVLTALEKGGPGAVLAGLLIWYLKARDTKRDAPEKSTEATQNHDCSELRDIVLKLADTAARQTEIMERTVSVIEKCAEAHQDHRVEHVEIKAGQREILARLDGRIAPPNGRHS